MVTKRSTPKLETSRSDNVNISKSNLFLRVSILNYEQRNTNSKQRMRTINTNKKI